jgi:DNA-binding beta-propeller fold protein YncE
VIDVTVTFTIAVGSNPDSLAITPDGLTLYVLHEDGLVLAIDTARKVATAAFGGGILASKVAVSPDGKSAYITSLSGILIVKTATNKPSGNISLPLENAPFDIVFSPDGAYAYALCGAGAAGIDFGILRINTQSLRLDELAWGTLHYANSLTITPDGHTFYIDTETETSSGPGEAITVYDISENTIEESISLPGTNSFGGFQAAVTPDGKYLYFPHAGNVFVIHTVNNRMVGSPIPIGTALFGLAIGPNGKYGYAVSSAGINGGGIVSVIGIKPKVGNMLTLPSQ